MTGYPDLDWWETHDGGEPIDGPTLLTDEPTGDAMHWTPREDECPVEGCGQGLHAFVKVDLDACKIVHLYESDDERA